MCGGGHIQPTVWAAHTLFQTAFSLLNKWDGRNFWSEKYSWCVEHLTSASQVTTGQGRAAYTITPTNRCYRASSTFIFFYYHVLRYLHSRAFFYCWKNLYTFLLILSMEKQQNQQKLIKVRRVREIQKRNLQNYFGHLRHWPTILEQNCTISGRWNRIGEETCKVRKKWKITPNYSNQF